jgi:HEAT repeat protein
MDVYHRLFLAVMFAGAGVATLGGCADGPVPELKSINPWARQQWAEDEREVTTYHRKVADLAVLRTQAASLPAERREEIALQLAARLKEEKSGVLRMELVRTLGEFAAPSAQQAVLASVADQDPNVRIAACKALGRHPDNPGFEALSQTLSKDDSLDVRIAATHELGKFKRFEAPPALRPALDDRDPALQLAAMKSLESLTGHSEYRLSPTTWREFLDGGTPTPPPAPTVAEVARQYWNWY